MLSDRKKITSEWVIRETWRIGSEMLKAVRDHIWYLVPLGVWLMLFQFTSFIPWTHRPLIDVTTLPALERTFFGSPYLFDLLPMNTLLIFVAAPPYLVHFILPWLFAVYLYFIDGKPFTFLWYIGILNLLAVVTQVVFPTAPPWYNHTYGTSPASYAMKGDPARFAEVDAVLERGVFAGLYGQSPLVFGSFPSLHGAWPLLMAVYASMLQLPCARIKYAYTVWVWFAAVYSKHHFLIDLVGGALYIVVAMFIANYLLDIDFASIRISSAREKRSETN